MSVARWQSAPPRRLPFEEIIWLAEPARKDDDAL